MKRRRLLGPEESALWDAVKRSINPMHRVREPEADLPPPDLKPEIPSRNKPLPMILPATAAPIVPPPVRPEALKAAVAATKAAQPPAPSKKQARKSKQPPKPLPTKLEAAEIVSDSTLWPPVGPYKAPGRLVKTLQKAKSAFVAVSQPTPVPPAPAPKSATIETAPPKPRKLRIGKVKPGKAERPAPELPPYIPPVSVPSAFAMPGIDRKTRKAIQRGGMAIDARIDLHGWTQAEAHDHLHRFLSDAYHRDLKLVLVITGKGIGGDGLPGIPHHERGVLKRMVPYWLQLPDFRRYVLTIEESHAVHGGSGAFYVMIRRGGKER